MYKVECGGNCCFLIYQRKRFLIFNYWSYMCTEVTFNSAETLINNLTKINISNFKL